MCHRRSPFMTTVLSLILSGLLLTAEGLAAEEMKSVEDMKSDDQTASATASEGSNSEVLNNAEEAVHEAVHKAAEVVQKIKSDAQDSELLAQAKALFIVPDYVRAALVVGGAGGQGVLITRHDDEWSAPAFYNVGTVNIGAAAGAEVGSVAFMIMSGDLMQRFGQGHNFALSSDAGYTIVDESERTRTLPGEGVDVVVWSDTEGLYADFAASVSNIVWDEDANRAYYGRQVAASEIIRGAVEDPMSPSPLRSEFASQ